jgi:membrane protease YdiL (CAAX protease family)
MLQFERLFKKSRFKKFLALFLSSIVFGFAHSYQDTMGIVFSGLIGLILGGIFYLNNRSLWLTILIHGFVDTAYLTLVYTSYDLEIAKALTAYMG